MLILDKILQVKAIGGILKSIKVRVLKKWG